MLRSIRLSIFFATVVLFGIVAIASPVAAATITVVNYNDPGEGFNDPAPRAPVGGNAGTTLGAQRLIAFQRAADIWGGLLSSSVTILVGATFDPLSCNGSGAVLGSAGPLSAHRSFVGAPVANTHYPVALANALKGSDITPSVDDITAQFNSAVGTTCSFPKAWYYGLDGNAGGDVDFVTVALHELGHGLGFLTFVDTATGAKLMGLNDTFMLNLEAHGASPADYPSMTDAQRVAAASDTGNLHWVGAQVRGASGVLTAGRVGDHVQMYAPTLQQPGSSVSHWDKTLTPNQLMEPSYTVPLDPELELQLFQDIGWTVLSASSPVISVTPSSQDFGVVTVGSFADRSFTVQNTGGGTLVGTASTSAPFSVIAGSAYSLGAGASQVVTVRFSPISAATFTGNVSFTGGGGATRGVSGSTGFGYALANAGPVTVTRGASGATTITATLQSGTTQAVSLAASGLPGEATASFNLGACSPPCTSTLTIATTAATPIGTFPITVTGSPLNRTTTLNLIVNAPAFTYGLTNSGNITTPQGTSGSNVITATLQAGTAQTVSFAASGLPFGASAAFTPGPCSPTCSTTLLITTTALTPGGTFPITVTGSPQSITTTFNLVVTPPFTYALSSSGGYSIAQGTAGANTITATLQSGTGSSVSFAASGLPSGATAGFNSVGSCTPTCSTTLTIYTTGVTPLGTYPITVTGSPLGVTTTFSLVVGPSFTYTLANQGGFSVLRGAAGAAAITATLLSGTPGVVSFAASGLPSGATAGFGPGACAITCSTTLSIATTAATPIGTFPITVTGSPSNVTTTFNLVVTEPFTYALANTGPITATAGASGTSTITATLQGGSSQAVSFAASGLPSGATASFSPGTCSPGCSTTLTIATTAATPPGTFPITVTGSPLSRITTINLIVSPQPTLTLSASVNQPTFTVGQTLFTSIGLTNPGLPGVAAVYLGTLRPDGSVEFLTSTGIVVGGLADLRPVVTDLSLATPFSVTVPNVSSHLRAASDPHGTYVFFFAMTSGAEVVGVATASYTFP